MSNLHGGKTLNDIIEQQKIEDRKQYQYRQELRRQQEERAASAMKAAEKKPYGKILDKQEEVKQLVNSIQVGSPRSEEYITSALKQICDILDFCLNEFKTDTLQEIDLENNSDVNPEDNQTEE